MQPVQANPFAVTNDGKLSLQHPTLGFRVEASAFCVFGLRPLMSSVWVEELESGFTILDRTTGLKCRS